MMLPQRILVSQCRVLLCYWSMEQAAFKSLIDQDHRQVAEALIILIVGH